MITSPKRSSVVLIRFTKTLGPGFLEKVYENALRIELEKIGLRVKQQEPINVLYDGHVVGEYYADLWVNEQLVIELKATQTLVKQHEVQLVNYLTATIIDNGLLLNFGPSVQVKRKFANTNPKHHAPSFDRIYRIYKKTRELSTCHGKERNFEFLEGFL